ncbi:MAG: aminotransferase class III-fold pyridoxal phosphate-dependent enzyme, partial [Candidatus Limnocylindrales bacterium]
ETVAGAGAFVNGFTFSHSGVGAATAREVLRILETESLVEASAAKGDRLKALLGDRFGAHPNVGEVRGRGLLLGLELVADRETRAPFPRASRLAEMVLREAREHGLLLYSGTGNADGVNGDLILVGPPFVVTEPELSAIVERLGDALEAALAAVGVATAGA